MTRAISISRFQPEFNDFLIAPVGNDSNGMLLSVLSALARQNVDPWQEAAELARLPRETAIQRLAVLIATLPDGAPPPHQNPSATAAALIALLPRRQPFETLSQTASSKAAAMTKHSSLVVIMMLFLAVMLCARYIAAASSQTPEHSIGARAPAASRRSPITAQRNLSPYRCDGLS
jgi:hypothetical protein